MAWRQLGFPILVRARIAPAQDALQLFVGPRIQIDRLDSANVRAHATMDARAADADKDAQVPTGPSRICSSWSESSSGDGLGGYLRSRWGLTFVPLAIGADFIGLQLEQALDRLLVLGCALSSWVRRSPGHLSGSFQECGTALTDSKLSGCAMALDSGGLGRREEVAGAAKARYQRSRAARGMRMALWNLTA